MIKLAHLGLAVSFLSPSIADGPRILHFSVVLAGLDLLFALFLLGLLLLLLLLALLLQSLVFGYLGLVGRSLEHARWLSDVF